MMNSCGGLEDSRMDVSKVPGLVRQAMGVEVDVFVAGANVGSNVSVGIAVAGTTVGVGVAWVEVEQAERNARSVR